MKKDAAVVAAVADDAGKKFRRRSLQTLLIKNSKGFRVECIISFLFSRRKFIKEQSHGQEKLVTHDKKYQAEKLIGNTDCNHREQRHRQRSGGNIEISQACREYFAKLAAAIFSPRARALGADNSSFGSPGRMSHGGVQLAQTCSERV